MAWDMSFQKYILSPMVKRSVVSEVLIGGLGSAAVIFAVTVLEYSEFSLPVKALTR